MQQILSDAVLGVAGLELITIVETADGALAGIEEHCPDLVILDLVLREGNGLDVLSETKRRAPNCRVLVFTAYDDEQYKTRCIAAGASGFYSKNRQYGDLCTRLFDISSEHRND